MTGLSVKRRVQRVPVDDQAASVSFVSLCPVEYKVQAGVVDVGQVLKVNMYFRVARNLFQSGCQSRQTKKRRSPGDLQNRP